MIVLPQEIEHAFESEQRAVFSIHDSQQMDNLNPYFSDFSFKVFIRFTRMRLESRHTARVYYFSDLN